MFSTHRARRPHAIDQRSIFAPLVGATVFPNILGFTAHSMGGLTLSFVYRRYLNTKEGITRSLGSSSRIGKSSMRDDTSTLECL